MATIAPAITSVGGIPTIQWVGSNADTFTAFTVQKGARASVTVAGSFGGATVKLQFSNDGTTWTDAANTAGTAISVTTATQFQDVGVYAVYLRPSVTGGTGGNATITVVLR